MRSPLLFALLALLLHGAPHARAASADAGNPGADFSDFVPVEEGEDVYEDETFMYFGKRYGLTVGTGAEFFSQSAGKIFDFALPIAEGRFNFYNDRWSTQLGVQFASHGGSSEDFGPLSLSLLRVSVDFRYYLSRGNPSSSSQSGRLEVSSPSPYVGLGLSYFSIVLHRHNTNEVTSLRSSEWRAPGLGRLPVPIIPSIAAGLDFALSSRSTVIGVEGRWLPLGSYSTDSTTANQIFNGSRLGHLFLFTTYLTFVFD